MTPIQSEALDLAARLFIWAVRLVVIGIGLAAFFAVLGGFMAATT